MINWVKWDASIGREHMFQELLTRPLKRSDTCGIMENICKYNTSTLLYLIVLSMFPPPFFCWSKNIIFDKIQISNNLNNLFVWKIQVVTPHRGFPGGGSPWASECLGSHGHKYLSTLLSSKGTASHSWVGKGYCRIFRPGISPTEVMAERERFVNLQEQWK